MQPEEMMDEVDMSGDGQKVDGDGSQVVMLEFVTIVISAPFSAR
jgi:hypothetical protein